LLTADSFRPLTWWCSAGGLAISPTSLRENDLAAVRVLSKRYAEVDRHMPFVASITTTPIAKG